MSDVPDTWARTILVLIAWWFVVGGLLVLAGCMPYQPQPPMSAEQAAQQQQQHNRRKRACLQAAKDMAERSLPSWAPASARWQFYTTLVERNHCLPAQQRTPTRTTFPLFRTL